MFVATLHLQPERPTFSFNAVQNYGYYYRPIIITISLRTGLTNFSSMSMTSSIFIHLEQVARTVHWVKVIGDVFNQLTKSAEEKF